jgi:hypothetical protein
MNDRDYFAAAALTGLLAAPTDKDRSMDYWARLAFEAADAMLRERDRVAETPEPQHVAETCRGERHDATPPEPPAAGVTLTDAEREAVRVARSHLQVASVEAWTLDERAQAERHAWALSCLLTRLGGST